LLASTTKKVLVRRFERESLPGFVNPVSYLQMGGVEVLSSEGAVTLVPYEEVKAIVFVRDFGAGDGASAAFLTRPKMAGLWVSFLFRDGEEMEGILPNNLLPLGGRGFSFAPPDTSGGHQKVFIPRAALTSVQVLGVVGSPLRKRKAPPAPSGQIGLFD
jgi:hypothetical protein